MDSNKEAIGEKNKNKRE